MCGMCGPQWSVSVCAVEVPVRDASGMRVNAQFVSLTNTQAHSHFDGASPTAKAQLLLQHTGTDIGFRLERLERLKTAAIEECVPHSRGGPARVLPNVSVSVQILRTAETTRSPVTIPFSASRGTRPLSRPCAAAQRKRT